MDRLVRINSLLQREVGLVLERTAARDLNCLVTVTGVECDAGLRHATVKISVYGTPEQMARAMSLLHARRPDIQREATKNIKMKYTPVLHFVLDETMGKAETVLRLLDKLQAEAPAVVPDSAVPEKPVVTRLAGKAKAAAVAKDADEDDEDEDEDDFDDEDDESDDDDDADDDDEDFDDEDDDGDDDGGSRR